MTPQQEWFYQLFGTANADHITAILHKFDELAGFGSQPVQLCRLQFNWIRCNHFGSALSV